MCAAITTSINLYLLTLLYCICKNQCCFSSHHGEKFQFVPVEQQVCARLAMCILNAKSQSVNITLFRTLQIHFSDVWFQNKPSSPMLQCCDSRNKRTEYARVKTENPLQQDIILYFCSCSNCWQLGASNAFVAHLKYKETQNS